VTPNLPKGIEFARYAMCLASAKGNVLQAEQIAKSRYPDMTRIHDVMKAAVAAGTTTDPVWAGDLVQYQQFAGDFVDFLRPQTIIGRFGMGNIPRCDRCRSTSRSRDRRAAPPATGSARASRSR
jgi:hypothetical protein